MNDIYPNHKDVCFFFLQTKRVDAVCVAVERCVVVIVLVEACSWPRGFVGLDLD